MESTQPKKGLSSLKIAIQRDIEDNSIHSDRLDNHLQWILDRATHYAEKLGTTQEKILEAWETNRTYWHLNYYQESNQPLITDNQVKIYENKAEFISAIGNEGFRCPSCHKISKDPQECTQDGCDWKSYGLFGTLGAGIKIIFKDNPYPIEIFKPIYLETEIGKNT